LLDVVIEGIVILKLMF